MKSRVFDLHDLIRSGLGRLLPEARTRRLELDLILEADSPVWVLGNPEAAAAGLSALVRSALDSTESGGVTIRVASDPGPASPEGPFCARVEVKGSGAPESFRVRGRRAPRPESSDRR